MHRIDTATADPDANGTGVAGFTDGNPGMAIPPTDLNASWFNTVQEELCNFITGQGISLTSAKTQLLAALRAPVGASGAAAISGTGGTSSGTGLKGTGGASNGIGVQGFGTGTGCGLEGSGASSPIATAATTGSGVVGRGGQTNGYGGEFFGKALGSGVKGTGGATSGAVGGEFVGGSTNGVGVTGLGGGTNGSGGSFIGVGTGSGLTGSNTASGYGVAARGKTSSPVKAALWIEPQGSADPSNPAQGDTYVNNTSGKVSIHNGTTWDRYVAQSYASITASTEISNTTSVTAFDRTYTIPANTLRVGSTIRLRASGRITGYVSGTVSVEVYLGSAILSGATGVTPTGIGDDFVLEAVYNIRAIGGSGSMASSLTSSFFDGASYNYKSLAATASLDTTADLEIGVKTAWSVASSTNKIRLDQLTIDVT